MAAPSRRGYGLAQHAEQQVDDDRAEDSEPEELGEGVGANEFQHAQRDCNRYTNGTADLKVGLYAPRAFYSCT